MAKRRVKKLSELPKDCLDNLTPKGRAWRLGRTVWDEEMRLVAARALRVAVHYSLPGEDAPVCGRRDARAWTGDEFIHLVSCQHCLSAVATGEYPGPRLALANAACSGGSVRHCLHCRELLRRR